MPNLVPVVIEKEQRGGVHMISIQDYLRIEL